MYLIKKTETNIAYKFYLKKRSGVGSLLYLVKHSQPELSNAVHELSKQMMKKTYREYVSRKENNNANSYVLQDEDESNDWAHIKIDTVQK